MIYYMDLPDGVRYVHVDNGRFQPRLTLAEIREFLEEQHTSTRYTGKLPYTDGAQWGIQRTQDVIQSKVRISAHNLECCCRGCRK
jgi:hypothetical protein